ncbi:alpha/beta hydrolase [Actinosynnema sp. NPDC020468]|uniref:alpha/beta fold hydrolase n=1 Tax=Actinosynnema sp. NPDC020468 TaxID=3154488 RepID=UPI0033F6FF54
MDVGRDVAVAGGRVVRVHEAGAGERVLVWHHGSPQTGALLDPVVRACAERGVRLISYGRPGYGGSTPDPGRVVASAADDVARVADALGVDRFAVMGASGGGPHALACAAALPDRVVGAVCLAGVGPYTEEFDWFAGMAAPGALRAAVAGERAAFEEEFDPESFTGADWAALAGEWRCLGEDAQRAGEDGDEGEVADDEAFVRPWGFDLADVTGRVLLVQGDEDRVVPPSHAAWQHARLPASDLLVRAGDGHISVLRAVPDALDWLWPADQGQAPGSQ